MQALWRLVQDHVWRQLVLVRPSAAAQNPRLHADMHRLSLSYCQTEGFSKMMEGVSKHPGWHSFKHHLKALGDSNARPAAPQRAAAALPAHRPIPT